MYELNSPNRRTGGLFKFPNLHAGAPITTNNNPVKQYGICPTTAIFRHKVASDKAFRRCFHKFQLAHKVEKRDLNVPQDRYASGIDCHLTLLGAYSEGAVLSYPQRHPGLGLLPSRPSDQLPC